MRLLISPGQDHDATCAQALLEGLERRAIVIADKGYDADRIRALIRAQGAIPNIPNTSNRKKRFRWSKALYRHRNQVERFFNKLKQFRRIATRYDKLGAAFFAFVQLAAVRISLRAIETFQIREGVPHPVPQPRFERTPGVVGGPPAAAGEHSREVLADWGFTESEIDALVEQDAIRYKPA